MTLPWRLWSLAWLILAGLVTALGLHPVFSGAPWPIAGLLAAVCLASFGLSVFVSCGLLALGVLTDFATDAPIGSWPLALLSGYGVALTVWDRQPPLSPIQAEIVALCAGLVAAGVGLVIGAGIAGLPIIDRADITRDLMMTALAYPAMRFLLIPSSIRDARR
jgi:hypothetical protein